MRYWRISDVEFENDLAILTWKICEVLALNLA